MFYELVVGAGQSTREKELAFQVRLGDVGFKEITRHTELSAYILKRAGLSKTFRSVEGKKKAKYLHK